MAYRKFHADQLFDGYKLLAPESVLVTDEKGMIEEIISMDDAGENVEHYRGILSPGFINCHCHLELSHLKNVIPPHTGLIEFLCSVVQKREAPSNFPAKGETLKEAIKNKMLAIENAEREMYENGIVAVGDICNTSDGIPVKSKSKIRWHSFIEVLNFLDDTADKWISHYMNVLKDHDEMLTIPNRNVLTPHAPYSISPMTFQLINAKTNSQIISIHNQEHPAENELYFSGGGDFLKLFAIFSIERSPFPVTATSSIRSYLPYFKNRQTILLIHNTYMSDDDIMFANSYAEENGLSLVYCLCPNANLYIENTLPPVEEFIKNNCMIVLGTDSYSSNWQLNITKEMETILNTPYFKKSDRSSAVETVLQWATMNGARAFQWDSDLGSFEKGKKPGVVLIESDFSKSKRVI